MTTPKPHLQAALDAITYNASVNQVFTTTEFINIKAHLDAVMEFLNEQDESYFDDGAAFEEFPAAEFIEAPQTPATVGTFLRLENEFIVVEFSGNGRVWTDRLYTTLEARKIAKTLQASCGIELEYNVLGQVIQIAELPF